MPNSVACPVHSRRSRYSRQPGLPPRLPRCRRPDGVSAVPLADCRGPPGRFPPDPAVSGGHPASGDGGADGRGRDVEEGRDIACCPPAGRKRLYHAAQITAFRGLHLTGVTTRSWCGRLPRPPHLAVVARLLRLSGDPKLRLCRSAGYADVRATALVT